MDILTILAGVIIVFSVGKNVVFSKNNSRKRNRQIITKSVILTADNNRFYITIKRL